MYRILYFFNDLQYTNFQISNVIKLLMLKIYGFYFTFFFSIFK